MEKISSVMSAGLVSDHLTRCYAVPMVAPAGRRLVVARRSPAIAGMGRSSAASPSPQDAGETPALHRKQLQ